MDPNYTKSSHKRKQFNLSENQKSKKFCENKGTSNLAVSNDKSESTDTVLIDCNTDSQNSKETQVQPSCNSICIKSSPNVSTQLSQTEKYQLPFNSLQFSREQKTDMYSNTLYSKYLFCANFMCARQTFIYMYKSQCQIGTIR